MTASIKHPSGYSRTEDFFATTSHQGELTMVTLNLPWRRLADLVVVPDPNKKSDYNRPLTVPHAKRFGQYIDITDDPFTPPMTLFTDPNDVELESLGDETLDEFGLRIAKIDRSAIVWILDGQHRIYGIIDLIKTYETNLDKSRQALSAAKRNGPDELVANHSMKVDDWRRKLDRLGRMEVTVQVLLTGNGEQARRIFADVADNAKGISKSQLADFSDRSVFNRVARSVSSTLLQGAVDPVNDRMSQKNPHWLALKDVVNVAQALEYPIGRRWTAQREVELKHREPAIDHTTRSFFEGLRDAFPATVGAILDASMNARELRQGGNQPSLLGSATTIRAMASAYRQLGNGERDPDNGQAWIHKPMQHAEIIEVWEAKLPPMDAGNIPDASGDPTLVTPIVDQQWMDTGVMRYPYYAPGASNANLGRLAEAVVAWTRAGASELEELASQSEEQEGERVSR